MSLKTQFYYRILHFALAYLPFAAILLAFIGFISFSNGKLPEIHLNFFLLALSFIVLITAFMLRALLWHALLQRSGFKVSARLAFLATSRSLVLKYLPGKVWSTLGRAGYIHQHTHLPLLPLSVLSTGYQILSAVLGLFIGLLGLSLLYLPMSFSSWISSFWACLFCLVAIISILWFLSTPRSIPTRWIEKLPGKRLKSIVSETANIPVLSAIAIGMCIQWLLLGLAYLLFFAACTNLFLPLIALLQPLAHLSGIIFFFVPGGLGVREGISALYLIELGVDYPLALALGILSRFWFFIAELLMLALSFLPFLASSPITSENEELERLYENS